MRLNIGYLYKKQLVITQRVFDYCAQSNNRTKNLLYPNAIIVEVCSMQGNLQPYTQ